MEPPPAAITETVFGVGEAMAIGYRNRLSAVSQLRRAARKSCYPPGNRATAEDDPLWRSLPDSGGSGRAQPVGMLSRSRRHVGRVAQFGTRFRRSEMLCCVQKNIRHE